MFFVYVIKSLTVNRFYIGSSANPVVRLKQHNGGRVKSTRYYRPWKLVYHEEYDNLSHARKREIEIKNFKGGVQFKALLSGTLIKGNPGRRGRIVA